MSRPRAERLLAKSRPKRKAAATHFFKYQLANNPIRAEENDLKRALQESLEEEQSKQNGTPTLARCVKKLAGSANSSNVSRSNNSTSSTNESASSIPVVNSKRTRSGASIIDTPINVKRAKLNNNNIHDKYVETNGNHNGCNGAKLGAKRNNSSPLNSTTSPPITTPRAIKTYSKTQLKSNGGPTTIVDLTDCLKTSTPVPDTTRHSASSDKLSTHNHSSISSKSPYGSKQTSATKSTQTKSAIAFPNALIASDLSTPNESNLKLVKKRVPQGSWSLIGIPEEKSLYIRDEEVPKRLICYPAIRHVEGDVIQVRDSVLLRSGARKTDLPYIAKVCAFWEDAETGNVMMSLLWYYRPEHTDDGRKPHHLADEIFASRHRDVDSVECIEDKCYVLTFNEYCRYKKRCKMEQVNTSWSLTDVTIPLSNESYPRRNRIPDSDVNHELVFCCRQIYDSRMRRLIKNPLINPKYGHI